MTVIGYFIPDRVSFGGEPIKMFSHWELTTSTGIIAVYYVKTIPTIYVFEWRKIRFKFPAVL